MSYFDTVVGHTSIVKHLETLVAEQKLPHSLLFHGEAGLGKLDVAIGLASTLIGRQVFSPHRGESYLAALESSHASDDVTGLPLYIDKGDAFWLRPMKQSLKVEQWYQLLRDHLYQISATTRVVIIEDFHRANTIFANAMLKMIEEPPQGVYFIILTNQLATVLPTIRSRCMEVSFQPVSDEMIRQMVRGMTGDVEAVVSMARGNPKKAKEWMEHGNTQYLDVACYVLEMVAKQGLFFTDVAMHLSTFKGEELGHIFSWVRQLSRDMVALRYGSEDYTLYVPLYKKRLMKLLDSWSNAALYRVVSITLEGEKALRLHMKPSLVVSGVLLDMRKAVKEDI